MRVSSILAAGLLACASQPALSAVISSLPGSTAVGFATTPISYGTQSGTLGDQVSWTSTSASTVSGWTYGYGFALNGDWSGAPMFGLNADSGTMTFWFDAPVQAVLADINWENYNQNVTMAIFDTAGGLLESASLSTLFAPGYLGFNRDVADIGSFALSNGYVGVRDLSFQGTPAARPAFNMATSVPEPAAWAMMIGGFGLVGGALRVRRRRSPRALA